MSFWGLSHQPHHEPEKAQHCIGGETKAQTYWGPGHQGLFSVHLVTSISPWTKPWTCSSRKALPAWGRPQSVTPKEYRQRHGLPTWAFSSPSTSIVLVGSEVVPMGQEPSFSLSLYKRTPNPSAWQSRSPLPLFVSLPVLSLPKMGNTFHHPGTQSCIHCGWSSMFYILSSQRVHQLEDGSQVSLFCASQWGFYISTVTSSLLLLVCSNPSLFFSPLQ